MNLTKKYVNDMFANLLNGDTKSFFNYVSDQVIWQVMGSHPLAGIYHSKEEFLQATFYRLNKVLKEGVLLKLIDIYLCKNVAIVELEALSTQNNGEKFNNTYCWIMQFNKNAIVTQVKAYLDSALVRDTINNNPHTHIDKSE